METEIDSCMVCMNGYSKSRKKIVCPKCQGDFCRGCFQEYINNSSGDVVCMHCKWVFSYDFIADNTTKVFMRDDYKKYLEVILFDKEKALIAETLQELEGEIRVRNINEKFDKLFRKNVDEIIYEDNAINIYNLKIHQLSVKKRLGLITDEELKTKNDIYMSKRGESLEMIKKLRVERHQIGIQRDIELIDAAGEVQTKERRQFIKPCPSESCRGLLSTKYICAICDIKVCPKCLEIKRGEDHECNPANIETANLIKESTRPCPKCGINIHRLSGCSDMFCPECKTAFNYNTGKIHNNGNSNPLYWQWRNSQGISEDSQECPEMNAPNIGNLLIKMFSVDKKLCGYIEGVYNFTIHVRDYEMYILDIDYIEENRDLRIDYLNNRISEEHWKVVLQRRFKDSIKRKDIRNVYQIYVIEVFNILFKINEEFNKNNRVDSRLIEYIGDRMVEYEKMRAYCNSQLLNISKRYNSVRYYITKGVSMNIKNYDNVKENEM